MTNPLIAPVKDSTTAMSGIPLLEDATGLKTAIESKNWAAVAIGAVGTALDVLTAVMDPFGAIFAAGVGWLMEHVGPLKEALDALTGKADEIHSQAETWTNVAKELESVSAELTELVKKDLQDWQGEAADTYRKKAEDTSALIGSAQKGSEGAASGVKTAGEIVAAVRSLVRDTIADLVGHLISWALQVLFTLGIGMAWVVPQVVSAVAKTASKITQVTTKLVKALKALIPLLKKAGTLFGDAGKALKGLKSGKGAPTHTPKDINVKSEKPKSSTKDESTTTSGDHSGNTHPSGEHGGGQHQTDKPEPGPDGPNGVRGGLDGHTSASGARGGQGNTRSLDKQGENSRTVENICTTGDPIDVASGQMVMTETDAVFRSALPMVFERAHFSAFRAGGWLGGAWVSTLDERVEVYDDQVWFAGSDGIVQVFPRPHGDEWVAAEHGPARFLAQEPGGGFVLEDRERQRILTFERGSQQIRPIRSIADRNDEHIYFERDPRGTPVAIRHSGGYRINIATEDGLVTGLSTVTGDGTEVQLVRYGYVDGNLTEVTNESGLPFRYGYDRSGRIETWSDRNGEWYRFHYDETGRVVRTEGSGDCLTVTMEYDLVNLVTHVVDSLGHRTAFHLNESGQLLREVNALGASRSYEWDANDRLLSETDELGRTQRYRYDELNNLIGMHRPDGTEWSVERNEFGQPVHLVEAPGVETRWEYDERGNVTRFVEPGGGATVYTYDEWGHLASVTDPAGVKLTVVSDDAGNPITVTDPHGATTAYRYDCFGRLSSTVDPTGAVEEFGYTVNGSLAWHRRADGSTDEWHYDGEGNNRLHADASSAITQQEVTHFDLISAEIRPDGTRLEYSYDTELRLTGVTNEHGQVWRYEYDPAGNLVRETDFGGASSTYRYNAAGELTEIRSQSGDVVTMSRDLRGNLVEEVVEGPSGTVRTRFEHDVLGQLAAVDDGTTRVEYTRDAAGRVIAETVNGRTLRSEYDSAGNLVRRRTPSGAESVWEYSEAGELAAMHTSGRTTRFEYDPAGREVRRTFGKGAAILRSWDPAGQLSGQAVQGASGELGRDRRYHYRPDGLPARIDDQTSGSRWFALDVRGRVTSVRAEGWSEQYAYDATGRLVDAAWPAPEEEDRLGRRAGPASVITEAGGVRYTYDDAGRMLTRQHEDGRTWEYAWGPLERLVAVKVPDGTSWRYTYDPIGRRTRKEHFAADGNTSLERVDFVWDGDTLVEETRSVDGASETTVWDYELDSFRPLLQRRRPVSKDAQDKIDAQFFAIVAEPSGTPTELLDDQGEIVWHARTSLFGLVVDAAGEIGIPLRFQGQYFDAETGLHYNLHRYYDPALARYVSPDPIGLAGGPDPHAYVSNPHVLVDPLGLAGSNCTSRSPSPDPYDRGPSLTPDPQGRSRKQSPGGTVYVEHKKSGKKNRRKDYGYTNLSHSSGKMRPIFQRNAVSPPPSFKKRGEDTKWYMDSNRRYYTRDYQGKPTGIVKGHSNLVMGHNPSASAHWNKTGYKNTYPQNKAHNEDPNSFGWLEKRADSDKSGGKEQKYRDATPSNGANRQWWDPKAPNYRGNPVAEYRPEVKKVQPSSGSGGYGGGGYSGGSGHTSYSSGHAGPSSSSAPYVQTVHPPGYSSGGHYTSGGAYGSSGHYSSGGYGGSSSHYSGGGSHSGGYGGSSHSGGSSGAYGSSGRNGTQYVYGPSTGGHSSSGGYGHSGGGGYPSGGHSGGSYGTYGGSSHSGGSSGVYGSSGRNGTQYVYGPSSGGHSSGSYGGGGSYTGGGYSGGHSGGNRHGYDSDDDLYDA
ncbi:MULTISPECIES: RHS repeat-associated core domain-containing protein [Amycolatopsis]|uniref:RHS repeat-associated core domain-containing protein n=5 Tax=Amycolatopsis TaxID=1813 RepID=A0ABW5HVZ5_9PSEU